MQRWYCFLVCTLCTASLPRPRSGHAGANAVQPADLEDLPVPPIHSRHCPEPVGQALSTRYGGCSCDRECGAQTYLIARSNRTYSGSPVLAHLVHPTTVSLTTRAERSNGWNRNNACT
jgi:hypothetical protein